jgi:hypothetical protein
MNRQLMSKSLVTVLLLLFLIIWPSAIQLIAANTSQITTSLVQPHQVECDKAYSLNDADPNETAEVIQTYWQGIELIRQGRWNEALSWFEDGVSRYPDSRHLHEGLAQVLWYLAVDGPKPILEAENTEYLL